MWWFKIQKLFFFLVAVLFVTSCGRPLVSNVAGSAIKPGFYAFGNIWEPDQFAEFVVKPTKIFDIQNGESVLSIGAGNGAFEVASSLVTDSVNYYLQDLNGYILNKDRLENIKRYYDQFRSKPNTSTFQIFYGKQNDPLIPSGLAFDRVIMKNSFHEIVNYKPILDSIYNHLSKSGKLVIADTYKLPGERKRHEGCRHPMISFDELKERLENSGFYYTSSYYPTGAEYNYHYFSNSPNLTYSDKDIVSLVTLGKTLSFHQKMIKVKKKVLKDSVRIEIEKLALNNKNGFIGLEEFFNQNLQQKWKNTYNRKVFARLSWIVFPSNNYFGYEYAKTSYQLNHIAEAKQIVDIILENDPHHKKALKLKKILIN